MREDLLPPQSHLHRGEDVGEQVPTFLRATNDLQGVMVIRPQSLLNLLEEGRGRGRGVEGSLPHQHGVEDDARGPNVYLHRKHQLRSDCGDECCYLLVVVGVDVEQLRSSVLLSAAPCPQDLPSSHHIAQAEVCDDHSAPFLVHHDVLELDVPVDDPSGMDVLQASDDLAVDVPGLVLRQPHVQGQVVQQVSARVEFHHQEEIFSKHPTVVIIYS